MLNANLIGLIFGFVMILILLLGSLWGFLAGLKRELKCLAIFIVVLGLMWVIFGGSASIDKNIIFGLSGTVNDILGTPADCTTWREIALYFGQNTLGLKEILIEGTSTYSLFMNVISLIVRGVYLLLGTVIALGLSGLIRLITHIVELIIRGSKKKKEQNIETESETETKKAPRVSMKHRLWGAGVGFLKSCLLVVLICAPITVLTGAVDNLSDKSEDAIEKVVLSNNGENTVIDWIFDVVEGLDNNIFTNAISESFFDAAFNVKTESGRVYLSDELNKLLEVADIVLPTYDGTKTTKFDIWALEPDQLDLLFDKLAESALIKKVIPVAIEYVGQMDNIQVMLKEAGLENLNEFVQKVDWESDLVPLLQTVKKALLAVNLNEPLDVMNLDSVALKDLIATLGDTTFFKELMPVAIDVALSLAIVKNFAGDVELSGKDLALDWKNELINLVDVYGTLQKLNIDLNNLNLAWLVNVIETEADFKVLSEALQTLTSGELFNEVLVPILDKVVEKQIADNNLKEFEGLISLSKMESEDWGHDLPIVLEMVGLISKLGVLSNDIKLNDYDTMHSLVDAFFELIILTDKVKVSVDSVDLKTLVVEAALRQFELLDVEALKFELLELRSEIDWNKEKDTIHNLIDTFAGFSAVVNEVQGFEITKMADIAALDFNALLASDGLWDTVLDLLDSVVDSNLISSALPYVFEKYISPIIFQVNGEIGEIGLFEKITAENVLAELYNLVYLALDLKEIGVFNVEAMASLDFNFGARAFIPENGFHKSEYFTYEPNATDLALVDIVERIFASAILNGREARFIRIILAGTLGVNVAIEELESINYSQEGSLSEKDIIVNGINQLKPVLTDLDFKIFVEGAEAGTKVLNINYFLDKETLDVVLSAVETLLESQTITYLAPEMYNQLFVAKGVVPADWAKILAVQSTYLGLTEGITSDEFKDDILSLIKMAEEIVKLGVVDIVNAEKANNVRIEDLVSSVTLALDTVIDLNIIDGKVGTLINKFLKDNEITIETSDLEAVNWDNELTAIKNIIGNVGSIAEYSGFVVYGDVQNFLATQPMQLSTFLSMHNVDEISKVLVELFNTEVLYDLIHGYVFDKLLANNDDLKSMLSADFYTSEMFRRDLLILADICYQLSESGLILSIGTFIFPEEVGLNFDVDLAQKSIAYLLEDILSLNILNNGAYGIFDTLLNSTGLPFDKIDLVNLQLANEYDGEPDVFLEKATKPNAFSEYNESLPIEDIVMFGDAFSVKRLYLSLFPIFNGEEFPIHDTASLKNLFGAFDAETIETYKKSEKLNEYVLALADALDILADMSITTVALEPALSIVKNMNIAFGTVTLADMLTYTDDFTKYDLLADVDTFADVIRNAVDFGLLDVLFKEADFKWTANEIYAQNIIKYLSKLNILEANIDKFVNMAASIMTAGQVEITLVGDVDLVNDGQKVAYAYIYLAEILENTLGIKNLASLSTLQIIPANFLTTDAASNILDIVKEVITLSVIEASLPGIAEAFQNTNLHPAIKELANLSDITSTEVLESVVDLTYPLKELVQLNVLDLLALKDISLEEIDTVPAIMERILNNKYVATKYASILEVARIVLGISVDSFDAYSVDWNIESTRIVDITTNIAQILQNCEFKTVNDIIKVINAPAGAKQYITVDNLKEVVDLLQTVVDSSIIKGLGGGFYQEILLPSLQPNLDPVIYNLITLEEEYNIDTFFNDLGLVIDTLETVVNGELINLVATEGNDEIDYVGIAPDVKQVLNYIFQLTYLQEKVDDIYVFINRMYPMINLDYIDYNLIEFAADGEKLGKAYELIAPLLDSEVNPYQTVSSFVAPAQINLAKGTNEQYKSAIEGLKQINDTTLLQVNNVVVLDVLKQNFAALDSSNIVGAVLKEIVNVSLDNGNHRIVSSILYDDINALLNSYIQELDAGALDALKDIENYNIVDTLLPAEVDIMKQLLDLRYLTELKGQAVLEIGLSVFGINDRLDFTTLTYENEKAVIGKVLDIVPSLVAETGCKSYKDLINFYNNIMNDLVNGTVDIKSIVSKNNVTNLIKILEELESSEILKQAAIPLYQAIAHPMFEATNNADFIDLTHIDQTIYTNEAFIQDYTNLVDMLVALNEFGIYDILFNDGIIDWSNAEVVDKVLYSVLDSNIYKYKETQIVKTFVNAFAQVDANMSLISVDAIKLSSDVEKLSKAYHALLPVLTKSGFPLQRLSDLTKQEVTIYLKDYTERETLKSVVEAVRLLNSTTLNEGTLAYTINLAKLMLNNATINDLLSYQSRGLNNKDLIADIDTLLADSELIIDAGFIDMVLYGTDINVVLPEVYEQIIRDVFDLNILQGQYANVVNFVAALMGLDTSIIDTSKLDQAADKEALVAFMKDAMNLLANNEFSTVTSFNKLLNVLTAPATIMDYVTNENIKSLLDIVKDGLNITLVEALVPTLTNKLASTYLIQELRPLVVFDDNYTYADLKADYNNYVYPMMTDLVDFGIVGIMKNNDVIDWDKQKANNTYYGTAMITDLLSIKYLESKKATLYNVFLSPYYPGVDVERVVLANEISNVTVAFESILPMLTSNEWTYNTVSDLVGILVYGFNAQAVLTTSNTEALINSLRSFDDSVLLEEFIGPFFQSMSGQLASWIDFSVVVNANAELAEYSRLLNILEQLNKIGFFSGSYNVVEAEALADLIDMIFGNETVTPAVEGLMCIVNEGECMLMLYNAGLLPTLDGSSLDIENITDEKWHEEIVALSNIIHALGAFCPEGASTIDLDVVINDIFKSTDVEALENVLINLNKSTLYRTILYRAIDSANSGSLSKYYTLWFAEQATTGMNDEWDQEVIILARLFATVNSIGGMESLDIDNYTVIQKGYSTGDAATDATYLLELNGEQAGLRQIYQLLMASKTYNIDTLKPGIELFLGL